MVAVDGVVIEGLAEFAEASASWLQNEHVVGVDLADRFGDAMILGLEKVFEIKVSGPQ